MQWLLKGYCCLMAHGKKLFFSLFVLLFMLLYLLQEDNKVEVAV